MPEIPLFMDKYKLCVEPASDSNLIKWNGFGKSKVRTCCRGFVHHMIRLILLLLAAYSVWYLGFMREELLDKYPEMKLQNGNP